MQRRFLLRSGSALFLILICSILLLATNAHVHAQSTAPTPAVTPTTTPDATQILQQASDARDKAIDAKNVAEEAAQQAHVIIDFINLILPIATFIILAVTTVLAIFGYNSFKDVKKAQEDAKKELESAKEDYQEELENLKGLNKEVEQLRTDFQRTDLGLASLRLGDILFQNDKRDMAIEAYEDAKKLLPKNALVNFSLGRAYSRMKRYDEAIELLGDSFNEKPDFPETSKELGLAYRRKGEIKRKNASSTKDEYMVEYRSAIKYLVLAVQLAPSDDDALATLGGLYKRLGEYGSSLNSYLRAAAINQNVSYPLGNIGSIQWYLGNIAEARETFKHTEEVATQCIERQVKDIYWVYFDRALARLILNRKDEAIADYRIAIDRTPGAVELESALDNLEFLKNTPNPKETINGLDEVIEEIKKGIAQENALHV